MQRLFSMFPQGGPGVALLLLRLSVAGIFAFNVVNRLEAGSHLVLVLALIVVLLLVFGFLTPITAVLAGLSSFVNLVGRPMPEHFVITILVPSVLDAVALALLGPGAYSVDAWLFGRRVMVVPPLKDSK